MERLRLVGRGGVLTVALALMMGAALTVGHARFHDHTPPSALLPRSLLSSIGNRTSGMGLILSGMVQDDRGKPVPGAFVTMNGQTVRADGQGNYTLTTNPVDQVQAYVWAPGYQRMPLMIKPSGVSHLTGSFTVNFNGQFSLQRATVNPAQKAVLHGLPIVSDLRVRAAHLSGHAAAALIHSVFVTMPNGLVMVFPLHTTGHTFTATLPLTGLGRYWVEINATSGFAVFNVLIFHGVAPSPPATPNVPPPPSHASEAQLAAYVLNLINGFRQTEGLPPLHLLTRMDQEALAHNQDMLRVGYFTVHPHIGSDGSTPFDRMRRTGLAIKASGEDVAESSRPAGAVFSFLESPSHREVLLGDYRWAGIGVSRDGANYLVTVDAAR